jgi:hypothetical protein
MRIVSGCLACGSLVLVPLASAANINLQQPHLSAPQFQSSRVVVANTYSPGPATMTVVALRSGAIVRSSYLQRSGNSTDALTFTFKTLPTGNYRLCVSQGGVAPTPATVDYPATPGWAAARRCAATQLATIYAGSFGPAVVNAALVNSKLSFQLVAQSSSGFNINGCATLASRSPLAVVSVDRGRFAASVPYRGRRATTTGIGPSQQSTLGPIFHGHFTIRGTVNARKVSGTIASSSAQCRWSATLRMRYLVTS